MKGHASPKEQQVYPSWWGHEEYANIERVGGLVGEQKSSVPAPIALSSPVDIRPAAGIKSFQSLPLLLKDVELSARYPTPKRMIDEITQTDLYLMDPSAPRTVEITSKIPLSSSKFTIQLEESKHKLTKKRQFVPRASDSFSHAGQVAKQEKVQLDRTVDSIRIDSFTQSSPIKTVTTPSSIMSSPVKEFDVAKEMGFGASPKSAFFQLGQRNYLAAQSSPFPESRPPPLNGVYSIAHNFLNGPIVQSLDFLNGATNEFFYDSKWLDDLSSQFTN
jgi:hypothetical protein